MPVQLPAHAWPSALLSASRTRLGTGRAGADAAAAAAAQITMRLIKARDKADRDYGELQAGLRFVAAPRMRCRSC